jgi:ATP/maltotriose-dependent transcriptional regulator MalT
MGSIRLPVMPSATGSESAARSGSPAGAGGIVPRPGLWERLGGQGRVAVVSAPPGSGKTVLLRSWISSAGLAERAAWVAVQRDEHDPQHLWLAVLDALRRTAAGSVLVRELTAAPDLDGWTIVERLLQDLAPLSEPLWLVIDDLHELGSAEALRQLELLVMRAPQRLRLVLATRHDLRLGLHRLRLQGELTEIRAGDLRFSFEESQALFQGRRGRTARSGTRDAARAGRRVGGGAADGGIVAGRAPGSGAVRGGVLRDRADCGRVPAGRGAGAPAGGGEASAAAHQRVGPRQRRAGRPADRG